MAQMNPTVGDLKGNAGKVVEFAERACAAGADLAVFPELALTGYPPEDLLLKPSFIKDNVEALKKISRKVRGITAVIGFVDGGGGDDIFNAAAVVHGGEVADVYHKMHLPNYGVFDEERYFRAGTQPLNFTLHGVTVGVGICEDIWFPEGPARQQALSGAGLIVNINASPYHLGKARLREEMLALRAVENRVVVAYNNTVGGQDELVFDGQGLIVDERGRVVARGRAFTEELIVADLEIKGAPTGERAGGVREITLGGGRKKKRKRTARRKPSPPSRPLRPIEEVFNALRLGTGDYAGKNGFKHAVIGLSGGIDSALVAAVAAKALGPENITGVFMPSDYTSDRSRKDAERLAKNLGIKLLTIPIQETFESYLGILEKPFGRRKGDVTEENLQARVRGNVIMALSNKFGWLALTTGNKSEMSVGYATLYGDMAGGFAVIKDVPKTMVYELSAHINRKAKRAVIPRSVMTREPSAELRPDQTDQDSLPPYEILDPILRAYVESDRSGEEIVAMGFDKATVESVIGMVDRSEYKRRQAPPGIKITPRAFGKDRRMPITNGYVKR